jgi:uncharacterized protein (TIGR03067 family)
MRILLLTILLVGAPFMAAETEPEPPASNADNPKATGPLSAVEAKFQGTWKTGYTIIIEGRDFCADTQPGEWYEGYIVIRPDEEPAQIDFVIEECPGCSFKGQASTGIFYFDGETPVVVAPPPGEARPKDFKTVEGEPRPVMRLKSDGQSEFPATHCLGETP